MRLLPVIVLVSLASATVHAARPPATTRAAGGMPPTLTVTGDAEVFARPDTALVRMGGEVQAEKAQAAQEQLNQVMQKAIDAVRALGIDEKDVRTTGLTLYPVYAQSRRGEVESDPRLVGHRAGNVLEIRLTDLSKVGPIIDAAIGAGANRLEGVTFELKNDLEARKQALAAAAKEAREKADALAAATGVTIESVDEVVEAGAHVLPPQPWRGSRMMAEDAMAASTPVQPGQVETRATVTVRYRIAE